MLLKIAGENIPQSLLESIAVITDHALLSIPDIKYDNQGNTVTFHIYRYPIIKKRILLPNKYKGETNHSIVTLQNVVSCNIQNILPPEQKEATLMFGIAIEDNVITLGSPEEDRGEPCFLITINVSKIDIELRDIE